MPFFSRKSASKRDAEAPGKSEKRADERADKTGRSSRRPHDAGREQRPNASTLSAVELLMADHRLVESLFSDLESAEGDAGKVALAQRICTELSIHAEVEERVFYPAAREAFLRRNPSGESRGHEPGGVVDEAIVEHRTLKMLIAEIDASSPKSPFFDANLTVLKEYVQHHVKEEERSILPAVQATDLDLVALGKRIDTMKKKLQASVELTKPPRAGTRPVVHVPVIGSGRAAGKSGGERESRAGGAGARVGRRASARASAPTARAESKPGRAKAGTAKASRATAGSTRSNPTRAGSSGARGAKRAVTKEGATKARSGGRAAAAAATRDGSKTSARRDGAKRASTTRARGSTAAPRGKRKSASTRAAAR